MKKNNLILILFSITSLISCKDNNDVFPLDTKYWTVEDYKNVVLELNYGYKSGEKLPNFNDPETSEIVKKLTDTKNFEIVLDDTELGVKHKKEISEGFFDMWKSDMSSIFTETDKTDKYLYELEMLEVQKFGLGLQLRYFQLGNDNIIEDSDDPNSDYIKGLLNSNIAALIGNYSIYLDDINNEKAFTDKGLNSLADGIDNYFPKLIELHPNSDYSEMKTKIELLINKTKSEKIKESLQKILELINSKKIEIKI